MSLIYAINVGLVIKSCKTYSMAYMQWQRTIIAKQLRNQKR